MSQVIVIYATDYGNTKSMAESIVKGANSVPSIQAISKVAEEATTEDLLASDAIVIGSPVHMGSPDWRIKKFIDHTCSKLWIKDALVGKVGGVFVSGGGYGNAGGGAEITLLALLNNMAELGLIMIPLPKNTPNYRFGGLQWGPCGRSAGLNMEQTGVNKESLEIAYHHGVHIAKATALLRDNTIFEQTEAALH